MEDCFYSPCPSWLPDNECGRSGLPEDEKNCPLKSTFTETGE